MVDANATWELLDTDESSGRQIFKRDVPRDAGSAQSTYGTYDFKVQAEFEVRDPAGNVLLKTSGTAKGEYWCGVFLWFVEGSNGTQVRLEESDSAEKPALNVPG